MSKSQAKTLVLTMPEFLRSWFFRNSTLLSPFMRAGHACLKDILNTCSAIKLDMGNIIVFQLGAYNGYHGKGKYPLARLVTLCLSQIIAVINYPLDTIVTLKHLHRYSLYLISYQI